uniref:Transposon TX1 uncharacterized n=1 Tax=Cajanus cajan TaxID=3821 RepID=A0A151RYB9_CAJCA|nr:Transposon TX1 uncharacterized [Cajanus cajan]
MCIQESKLKNITEIQCQLLWGETEVAHTYSPAQGTAGGLICLWNPQVFEIQSKFSGEGFLGVVGIWKEDHTPMVITNVYSPCTLLEKKYTFQESEVKEAIWECEGSKSPGPDGFNFTFIKRLWVIMKRDIMRFVEEFHTNGKLPSGTNSSFIALIPKVADPQELGKFRPISLVGCMYKIIAKILARRLKKVLQDVIDNAQSAFLGGRNLLQSILVASEVIDEAKKEKRSCIFFKVDFEKAYDTVNWGFLLYMLQRLGFNCKWRQWIMECLVSAKVSVLVNRSPTEEFTTQRGLRQGDPLAPFLFLVVAEGMSGMMREAVNKGLYNA